MPKLGGYDATGRWQQCIPNNPEYACQYTTNFYKSDGTVEKIKQQCCAAALHQFTFEHRDDDHGFFVCGDTKTATKNPNMKHAKPYTWMVPRQV